VGKDLTTSVRIPLRYRNDHLPREVNQ